MQARDVMTTSIVTVAPETPVEAIAQLLLDKGVSAVPVVDAEGRALGIVSEGDLILRQENGSARHRSWWLDLFSGSDERARDYLKSHGHTAADVMTKDIVSVAEDTSVAEIAALLEKRRIKRVPVLRDDKLAGIVSRADLLRALAAHKAHMPGLTTADDREIREAILDLVAKEGWISHGSFNVLVTDGKVELWGLVDSDDERRALMLAVEDLDGVKSVEDHLGLVPPYLRGA